MTHPVYFQIYPLFPHLFQDIYANLCKAFIDGYESIRPLSDAEKEYFPVAQRAGCVRFWVSRLLDFHFPQEGEMTFIKDPNVFRDLLLSLS